MHTRSRGPISRCGRETRAPVVSATRSPGAIGAAGRCAETGLMWATMRPPHARKIPRRTRSGNPLGHSQASRGRSASGRPQAKKFSCSERSTLTRSIAVPITTPQSHAQDTTPCVTSLLPSHTRCEPLHETARGVMGRGMTAIFSTPEAFALSGAQAGEHAPLRPPALHPRGQADRE